MALVLGCLSWAAVVCVSSNFAFSFLVRALGVPAAELMDCGQGLRSLSGPAGRLEDRMVRG